MSKTISQLPIASTVASADVFPLDQGGLTKQATLSVIAAGLPSSGTGDLVRKTNPIFDTIFVSNINGLADSGAYSIVGGSSLGVNGGAFVQVFGGTNASHPGKLFFGSGTLTHSAFDASGNLGIGTLTPAERLSVAGNIRVANPGGGVFFTDTAGGTPYMVGAVDGNFYFTTKNSAGVDRGVFRIAMRSDTSPLQVDAPLKIGTSGAPIQNVLTTTFNHTPAAIAANGGVQTFDVTLTGATPAGVTLIECPAGVSNNAIVLKANFISANTIRVYWINPTAASVTLSNANYRVAVINF
jgi:hypothetical protein